MYFPKVYSPKVYFSKMYFFNVYFSNVYLSKVYFCKMYPICVSSKLCEFNFGGGSLIGPKLGHTLGTLEGH